MQNRYIAPRLTLYRAAEDNLMLSSELPSKPGGDGTIELPPIQMRADMYTPPSVSIEDAPTDILMGSVEGGSGSVGDLLGGWGEDTGIEFPIVPQR